MTESPSAKLGHELRDEFADLASLLDPEVLKRVRDYAEKSYELGEIVGGSTAMLNEDVRRRVLLSRPRRWPFSREAREARRYRRADREATIEFLDARQGIGVSVGWDDARRSLAAVIADEKAALADSRYGHEFNRALARSLDRVWRRFAKVAG